ncbi:vacuolar-type H+-ATPase subunit H [Elusimicrobium simillimum]|uniref:hypothetical protein n=1 Tax=Elusimicrobium simillimum TaxID=3143438 RepID=UPI003C6EBC86
MLKKRVILLLAVFVLLFNSFAWSSAASAKKLELGKKQFAEGNYDDARANFIDVMMSGTPKEFAEANQYINRIHNQIGNVSEAKFIPDVDPVAEARAKAKAEADAIVAQAQADAEAIRTSAEQQAQAAQQNAQSAYDQAQADAAAARANAEKAVADYNASLQQGAQNAQTAATAATSSAAATAAATTAAATSAATAAQQAVYDEYAYYANLDPNSYEASAKREQLTATTLATLRQAAIDNLINTKGVKVYFRNNDVDAIDMDSEVLFDSASNFKLSNKTVLENLYTLMVLSPKPSFVILPAGSYTDNVSLSGVKQAISLSSYMVYSGISPAKISYNMGLYNEQPPAKFSNLDGLSVVFDYDATPELVMKDSGEKLPLMSLAIVPPAIKWRMMQRAVCLWIIP